MKEAAIIQEAVTIAKREAINMPVIIFSDHVKDVNDLIPEAIAFEGAAGE